MHLPSVDIFIGLAFLVGIAYGFVLKRDKVITLLCSVYIGIVVSSSFAETVFRFFNGNATIANQIWIKSNASLSTISIAIFLISVFFISGAINSSTNRSSDVSPLECVFFGAFFMALTISTVLFYLPAETTKHYMEVSWAARFLLNYRTLLIIAAPLTIIILNFRRK